MKSKKYYFGPFLLINQLNSAKILKGQRWWWCLCQVLCMWKLRVRYDEGKWCFILNYLCTKPLLIWIHHLTRWWLDDDDGYGYDDGLTTMMAWRWWLVVGLKHHWSKTSNWLLKRWDWSNPKWRTQELKQVPQKKLRSVIHQGRFAEYWNTFQ